MNGGVEVRTRAGQDLIDSMTRMFRNHPYWTDFAPSIIDRIQRIEAEAVRDDEPVRRWIESLHEDDRGLVWTTKAELRALIASALPDEPVEDRT